jgi:tripartite-type tricarboxylate transporter receptor subunit TctC
MKRREAIWWACTALPLHVLAQSAYPNKPLVWIVPWAAGGSADFAARSIGAELSKQLGQTVVIDNTAGAGGILGMHKAAQSPPDGYTIYFGGSEMFVPPLLDPKKHSFDWQKMFRPVGQFTEISFVIAVPSDSPIHNLDQLVAFVRRNPGKLFYGSPGIASSQHLLSEMMREKARIPIVHVPYRGGAMIVNDLIGGYINMAVLVTSTALPHIRSGKLRALAVSTKTRSPLLPDVPPLGQHKEFSGIDLGATQTLFVPLATPDAVVQRLSQALKAAMAQPELRKTLVDAGATPVTPDATAVASLYASETAKYKRIIDFTKPGTE